MIGRIPGVHHAGAAVVAVKSGFDNRGAKQRALEARCMWLDLLNGTLSPQNLPPLQGGEN
jgi:hypothetical protein